MPSLVEIGLTDLLKYGSAYDPPAPPLPAIPVKKFREEGLRSGRTFLIFVYERTLAYLTTGQSCGKKETGFECK